MKRIVLKVFHGFVYFFYVILFYSFFPISHIFFARKKIWLISERGYDARDNGLHFFKYISKNHPEVNCYYVIDKKSSDYKHVKEFKNVIQFGLLKHIFYFSCAKVKISTQMYGYAPNKYYIKLMQKHHLQGKNVGLKHGIFKNIHPNYFKKNSHLDLIVCGAKPEFEFIKQNFGYQEKEVVYCGLARFDNLGTTVIKNQILVMPTFRIPLTSLSSDEFVESEYFKKWNSLLSLLDKNIQNDYKVIFYIHAVFQKYISVFENRYQNIIVAKFEEFDVQQLLNESKLLITDYSSVFFDFAYMKKPIIFYQFDEEYFNSNHYEKGYFDYRKDGFGNVVQTDEECLREVNQILRNNCEIASDFAKKVDLFFTLPHDRNNCKRIFEEIVNIL